MIMTSHLLTNQIVYIHRGAIFKILNGLRLNVISIKLKCQNKNKRLEKMAIDMETAMFAINT